MDGRWYRLRDVAGGAVILGIAIPTGSSNLFGSGYRAQTGLPEGLHLATIFLQTTI